MSSAATKNTSSVADSAADTPSTSNTGQSKTKDRWYVCTDFKRLGGKVIQTSYGDFLGPYDTVEEALACRFGFEQGSRGEGRYYVDNWADAT